jgi:hypothetical protein
VRRPHGWAALFALAACGGTADEAASPAAAEAARELPVLGVGAPTLEIGDLAGGGPQTLDLVGDVVPIGDDRLLVVDRGASTVRVFDRAGGYVRSVGRFGDGPGEFRLPGVVIPRGDTLWVADEADRTISRLLLDGRWVDEIPGPELHGDDRFPLDAVLRGRTVLEGVLDPEVRDAAEGIVAGLGFGVDRPGYRLARATADGGVWFLERRGAGPEPTLWVRLDADGEADALVELPSRFDPLWIGGGEVLGRWRGEFDVHWVHAYALAPTGRTAPAPEWTTRRAASIRPAGEERDSTYLALKMASKNVAAAQELHYADHGTYSMDLDAALAAANIRLPEGVEAWTISADSRGHRVVLSAAGFDALCALAMGDDSFSGVYPGAIACGDEDEATRWDTPKFGAGKGADGGKGITRRRSGRRRSRGPRESTPAGWLGRSAAPRRQR